MHHTSRFYRNLSALLTQQTTERFFDLTGVQPVSVTQPSEFDSIPSLLESDAFTAMMEEIHATESPEAQYLKKQIVLHEDFYKYEAQEAQQQNIEDLFMLRRNFLQEHGPAFLFLPEQHQTKQTLNSYSAIVQKQHASLAVNNPINDGNEKSNSSEQEFQELYNLILQLLEEFEFEKENVSLHAITPDHPFKGGYAIGVPTQNGQHSYVAYTEFPDVWLTLSVVTHELGHALYYKLISNEPPEISLERSELWNECIAEALSIYIANTLNERLPELLYVTRKRALDAIQYSLDVLNVLLKDIADETDMAIIDESLDGFVYTLYDPFRYFVSAEIALQIAEQGSTWFMSMIRTTNCSKLDDYILEFWNRYTNKYSS